MTNSRNGSKVSNSSIITHVIHVHRWLPKTSGLSGAASSPQPSTLSSPKSASGLRDRIFCRPWHPTRTWHSPGHNEHNNPPGNADPLNVKLSQPSTLSSPKSASGLRDRIFCRSWHPTRTWHSPGHNEHKNPPGNADPFNVKLSSRTQER